MVQEAAAAFVDDVNRIIMENDTSLCSPLRLNRVLWAANLLPTDELVHFKKSADPDGFVPDLTDNMVISKSTFQLKLETLPGNGLFEVQVSDSGLY